MTTIIKTMLVLMTLCVHLSECLSESGCQPISGRRYYRKQWREAKKIKSIDTLKRFLIEINLRDCQNEIKNCDDIHWMNILLHNYYSNRLSDKIIKKISKSINSECFSIFSKVFSLYNYSYLLTARIELCSNEKSETWILEQKLTAVYQFEKVVNFLDSSIECNSVYEEDWQKAIYCLAIKKELKILYSLNKIFREYECSEQKSKKDISDCLDIIENHIKSIDEKLSLLRTKAKKKGCNLVAEDE
jgi:hypothetical protein